MPQFVITGPDGKKYKVSGPDAQGALNALKAQLSQTSPQLDGSVSSDIDMSELSGALPDAPVGRSAQIQRQWEALPSWKKPIVSAMDIGDMALSGLSFGYADKALAKVDEMAGRGSYEDRLRFRRQRTDDARERAGIPGMAAEIGGSLVPAARLMKAGVTAMNLPKVGGFLGPSIDGLGYGALTALGNDADVTTGALTGAGLGFLGTAATGIGSQLFKPVSAAINPDKATAEVIQKTIKKSKQTPQQVVDDMVRAADDGQGGVYALADALGYPGQRLVSTITRTPNEGRVPMRDFLEKRQSGQGRRIANALVEGFGDPATAMQKVKSLKEARTAGGDVNYTAAREKATSVNITPVLNKIDELAGGSLLGVKDGVDPNSISGALLSVRKMLAGKGGAQSIDFDRLLTVRSDISDMTFSAPPKRAGKLRAVLRELDAALADASPGYRKALEQYAQDSKMISAVDIGTAAAKRGRIEDTIPAFQAMGPGEQMAFRAGYADPLIEATQGAATGVNKARALMSDATEAEFPAFAAPGQGPLLGRRIAREDTMFKTRQQGLGGSQTADNLAEEADLSMFDPTVLGNLFSLNLTGAARQAVIQTLANLKGQPPAVRERLANILMQTDPRVVAEQFRMGQNRLQDAERLRLSLIQLMTVGSTTAGLSGTASALPPPFLTDAQGREYPYPGN